MPRNSSGWVLEKLRNNPNYTLQDDHQNIHYRAKKSSEIMLKSLAKTFRRVLTKNFGENPITDPKITCIGVGENIFPETMKSGILQIVHKIWKKLSRRFLLWKPFANLSNGVWWLTAWFTKQMKWWRISNSGICRWYCDGADGHTRIDVKVISRK